MKPTRLLRVLGLACLLLGWSAGPASANLIDATGDTFNTGGAKHDIVFASADYFVSPGNLRFVVRFAGQVTPPSAGLLTALGGYIDIDADQNPFTPGSLQAAINAFMPPVPGPAINMDADFTVDLYSEQFNPGFVTVFDAALNPVANVPITFGGNTINFDLPLSVLLDSGVVNYSLLVGNFGSAVSPPEFTDRAPDGVSPAQSIPEPTSLALFGGIAAAGLGWRWRRRRASGPDRESARPGASPSLRARCGSLPAPAASGATTAGGGAG
jgi:hypothetical protein